MPTHLVQTSFARIAVIVGGILQDIYAVNSASIHTFEKYTQELDLWLSTLPQPLRSYADYTGGEVRPEESNGDRIAMVGILPSPVTKLTALKYNLELMYLGSMLLLTKPLLLDFTGTV